MPRVRPSVTALSKLLLTICVLLLTHERLHFNHHVWPATAAFH